LSLEAGSGSKTANMLSCRKETMGKYPFAQEIETHTEEKIIIYSSVVAGLNRDF